MASRVGLVVKMTKKLGKVYEREKDIKLVFVGIFFPIKIYMFIRHFGKYK